MGSFGDRLRDEREARRATIEDVSGRTGIRLDYLQALENGRFAALPGRAFGKMYIRAYGEILGFDPRALIEQYDRERAEWDRNAPARPPEDPAEEEPPEVESAAPLPGMTEQPLSRRPAVAALIVGGFLVTAAIGSYGYLRRQTPELPPAHPAPPASMAVTPPPGSTPSRASTPAGRTVTPPVSPPRPEAPVTRMTTPRPAPKEFRAPLALPPAGSLSVVESGIGRRVANHHLEGESDRFATDDRAIFWTHVSGGADGTPLRHVWMRDGRTVQTIDLTLGGADWRTWSRKTVHEPGAWSVEARDAAGNVLARAEFLCAPR